jgi:N,N'-diacetyllegionaminate synthase
MADLVRGIRAIETMLAAKIDKAETSSFMEMKRVFEKSLVVLRDIPAGTVLTPEMIGIKKPGTGLPPGRLKEVIGKRTLRAVKSDTVLMSNDIEWEG